MSTQAGRRFCKLIWRNYNYLPLKEAPNVFVKYERCEYRSTGMVVLYNFVYLTMPDVHTKSVRSYNMSKIRSKDTKPELIVRKFIFANGFRYRLHGKNLPGKPDIVLKKLKTTIFIHGCFWHGHAECKYYVVPKTRTEWWLNKINGNISNDTVKKKKIKKLGWNVLTIWECDLKSDKREATLKKFLRQLNKLKL